MRSVNLRCGGCRQTPALRWAVATGIHRCNSLCRNNRLLGSSNTQRPMANRQETTVECEELTEPREQPQYDDDDYEDDD